MKILQNEILGTQTSFLTILVVYWVSSCLSFFMSASTPSTYLNAPTCTTTTISLKPYALNAEFQHFILRFNKISLLCKYHWRRDRGWKQAQMEAEDRVSLWLTQISTSNLAEVRTLLVSTKSMLQGWKCVEMFAFVHVSLKLKKHVLKAPWTLHALCIGQMQHLSTSALRQLSKTNLKCYLTKVKLLQTIWGIVGHTIPFQESLES